MAIDPAEVWKTASRLLDNKPKATIEEDPIVLKYKELFDKIEIKPLTPLIANLNKKFAYKINRNYYQNKIFKNMTDSTLFFIFFDKEYENYKIKKSENNANKFLEFEKNLVRNKFYALQTLKSKGWRFHTLHKTFFYRLNKPKIFAKDHEVGDYAFYNPTTCTVEGIFDFVFEFQYLEMF